jgi:hypothetical protein
MEKEEEKHPCSLYSIQGDAKLHREDVQHDTAPSKESTTPMLLYVWL